MRGTDILPDMWLAHYTQEQIDKDIELLRRAYTDGVRVCEHVNRDELYEALDRAGIVAWQDFSLQPEPTVPEHSVNQMPLFG